MRGKALNLCDRMEKIRIPITKVSKLPKILQKFMRSKINGQKRKSEEKEKKMINIQVNTFELV